MFLDRRTLGIRSSALVVFVTAIGLAAACTPPPPPPADPGPPVIGSFTVAAARTEAPVTAVYSWYISDPNPDLLTCRIDVDTNGTYERTITPCTPSSLAIANFTTAGTRTATLEVSDGVFPPVVATTALTVSAGPSETFDITIRVDSAMAPEFRAAFTAAELRWEQVIAAGVPDQYAELGPIPFDWVPAFAGVIDDLMIDARDTDLGGVGGLLGRAGAFGNRTYGGLPYWGIMEFDTADLQQLYDDGELNAVILHEMGHVLGIGGPWITGGLLTDLLTDPRYTGAAGNAVWQELGGTGRVPVESGGGIGTQWVHWRESTFRNELMTGYLSSPPNPLSRLTIAALADIGYGVDLSQADPYALPPGSSLRTSGALPRKIEVERIGL